MATMNERLQTYTGDGLEVGTLTLAEARERFDFAEVEVSETGHRTITVGEPIEMEWSETPGNESATRAEVIAHAAEVSAEGAVANADAETVQSWRTWEPQDADLDGLQADLRRAGLSSDLSRDERAEFATAFAEAVAAQVARRFPKAVR